MKTDPKYDFLRYLVILIFIAAPLILIFVYKYSLLEVFLGTVFAVSVLGNFFTPLDVNFSQDLELALEVNRRSFQPVYITKQGGVTESVNACFTLCPNKKNSDKYEVEKINFSVIKYSGLLNHKIRSICVKKGPDRTIVLTFKMRFLTFKKEELLVIDELCDGLKERFCVKKGEVLGIYTRADYGLYHEFKLYIHRLLKEMVEGQKLADEGSICNIRGVHSESQNS